MTTEQDERNGVVEVLDKYADDLCEGWCEESPEWAHFGDCGGCLARRTAWKFRTSHPNAAEPMGYLYHWPEDPGRTPYFQRERISPNANGWLNGWTETPLYAHPPTPQDNARADASSQARIEALEAENARLREANHRLRNGYADAASGLEYVRHHFGNLSGVGFQRVEDHFFEWVTMPEREGLLAGSHELARTTLETPND